MYIENSDTAGQKRFFFLQNANIALGAHLGIIIFRGEELRVTASRAWISSLRKGRTAASYGMNPRHPSLERRRAGQGSGRGRSLQVKGSSM